MLRTRIQQGLQGRFLLEVGTNELPVFRARIHQCPRGPLFSLPSRSGTSAFHTSQPTSETRRSRLARASKKENVEKRAERVRTAEQTKPDPVLGHSPGDDAKWLNSDLAKVLISQRELQAPENAPPPLDPAGKPNVPPTFQWGLSGDPAAQHLLLDSLPEVTSQLSLNRFDVVNLRWESQQTALWKGQMQQLHNTNVFSRISDLRNASAAGIAFENRRRCVAAFSERSNPNDTGRPEVQAAILTMKIRKLWEHLQRNRKDIANKRSLRMLVHQRAKILKYLKRLNRARYETVLGRLGIEEGAIEGELVV